MLRSLAGAALMAATAAIASAPDATGAATRNPASPQARPSATGGAERGRSYAEQHCLACHAIAGHQASPNPEAPPFEDIANRAEVTAEALQQYLRNSHNYPATMSFTIETTAADDLATYIATLKRSGYRPVM
jgi:mono/diheme cytochrome c family protein